MNIFLICCYGVPKNIEDDQNYLAYLNVAFNNMYARATEKEAVIIPCGGPTNTEAPYKGTEAAAIADYVKKLMHRPELSSATKAWRIVLEDRSLSTLENLLFAKHIIDEQKLEGDVTIFCEATRRDRIIATAEKIFDHPPTVIAIDFDISKNRYTDPALMKEKDALALKESLWTLEKPERLAQHHQFFEQKLVFLREKQSEGLSHVDAVAAWYKEMPALMQKLMPEHPLLKKSAS